MARRYDSRTTIFSPEGRLYQVEYAMEAISLAGIAIGILAKDGVVIAAEKKTTSKLLEQTASSEKIYTLSENMICGVAGMTADANILINWSRTSAQRFLFTYNEPIPCEQLVQRLCDLKQGYTQYGGLRPFGVSFIFAGWDSQHGFQLYHSDPSGNYGGWKATSIGSNSSNAQSILKQDYKEDMDLNEAKALAVKVLSKTMDSTTLSSQKLEFATVTRKDDKVIHSIFKPDEIDALLREHNVGGQKEEEDAQLLSKEQAAGESRAFWEGGLRGAVAGATLGAITTAVANQRSAIFKSMSNPFKAVFIGAATVAGGLFEGDRANQKYDREKFGYADAVLENVEEVQYRSWKEELMGKINENRWSIIGFSWVGSMIGALAYTFRDKYLTTQQKVVQARMYAQAATIGVLLVSAGIAIASGDATGGHKHQDDPDYRLRAALGLPMEGKIDHIPRTQAVNNAAFEDSGMPTPTRFLKECGDYNFTPSYEASFDVNPFDYSFNSASSAQNNTTKVVSTPADVHSKSEEVRQTTALITERPNASTALTSEPNMEAALQIAQSVAAATSSFHPVVFNGPGAIAPSMIEPSQLSKDSRPHLPTPEDSSDSGDKSKSHSFDYGHSTKACKRAFTPETPPGSETDHHGSENGDTVAQRVSQRKRVAPVVDRNSKKQAMGTGSRPTRTQQARPSYSSNASTEPDPDDDEETKRRKFLERNRQAASKCRQKKKAWTQQLESRSEEMAHQNKNLHNLVSNLKEQLMQLKNHLLAHRDCGCDLVRQYVGTSGQFQASMMNSSLGMTHAMGLGMGVGNTPIRRVSAPGIGMDMHMHHVSQPMGSSTSASSNAYLPHARVNSLPTLTAVRNMY
ncbi:hypothetical protein BZG36_01390 [Bifiguratus adelaidae]|uniref:BZIP domain-containing protein n=1 Tax=Bifiguratus adelaidae TaxID=1938954 RepID=A0A261Y3I3_9FUNG|nr:hypothetical protein BZG36_01390 [Bifiguratus adelaidae]